jgi:hypothetical protein
MNFAKAGFIIYLRGIAFFRSSYWAIKQCIVPNKYDGFFMPLPLISQRRPWPWLSWALLDVNINKNNIQRMLAKG